MLYQANAATYTLFSKGDKILIKNLYKCKGYNARQFITEFLNKGWKKNSINRLLVKFGTVDRRAAAEAVRVLLMKTSSQSSRYCWVRKTNPRAVEQSEKFHVRRGIHRSPVSRIIHKDLRLKCCKKRRAQQLTEAHSMYALFSVCSLRDDNWITSKSTWKLKHAISILEHFEYFWQISSKSTHIISSYTVSKLAFFWYTV